MQFAFLASERSPSGSNAIALTNLGRELDIAQLLQLPPHGRLIERDGKFLVEPPGQIDQSPAHTPMDRRDRATPDDRHKRLTLGSFSRGRGPGALPSRRPSGP